MTALARFTLILANLRAAVAAHAARDRAQSGLFVLLWGHLARAATRFETLFARWRAGNLPKIRPARAGQARPPRARSRLPTWLPARVPDSHALASQLQHLLSDPEIAEFLAAVPRAGRILRPLCRMLGIETPAAIRLEPKPRKPRALRPPKPKPAPFRVPIPKGAVAWIPRRRRFSAA